MKRLIFQVLLGTAAVLACATLAMKGGEKASARKHSKFKVIHVTPHGIAPTADACGSPFSNRTMNGIDATP